MIGLALYYAAVLTMAAAACGHQNFLPRRLHRPTTPPQA
jgi:hypothetical protein